MARPDGVPCWAELDIGDGADTDAVAAFYAAVLGWSINADIVADHQHGDRKSVV